MPFPALLRSPPDARPDRSALADPDSRESLVLRVPFGAVPRAEGEGGEVSGPTSAPGEGSVRAIWDPWFFAVSVKDRTAMAIVKANPIAASARVTPRAIDLSEFFNGSILK